MLNCSLKQKMKKKTIVYKILFVLLCVKSHSEIQIDSEAKDNFWSFCPKTILLYILKYKNISYNKNKKNIYVQLYS